ncbi:UDP-N-acetylmuramoyl-tripeptide--D-alanyl-D-alanine ligase [Pasteurella bettyae]|uniref:UDP-N-acetylmuramoyl-tripeptide--D-alanyl-D-alanine ligase n=1 Tax=Pasteurella bettyae CCUG 2042 TaxID=1095749 RepID=I3D7Q7_9PAST|nr:UDP-N-acetylmuramoyl-tripeptide--D-alanyl-D-alanine ligase [Pasteurella bettyae]EIJ67750.1 UDP-N-acetylmuramoyl-tripeptide--D-alanyl-D-alanine ligase [Pasteurella bettyae CCUG 2042]SUB22125.1 UDP-N-acetylmuramoyl-tripeptide--D-alanyl-D-alanine ligase [Pasteurella bettyae]
MIKLNVKKIADILKAKLIGDETIEVENVSTDTRQSTINGLFFALKGEKFDAHSYLDKAVEQGCIAVVVDHKCQINVPQIIVQDTRLALGQLAAWLKAEIAPMTVAMTGSSGKTTVKEMTASILQQVDGNADSVLFTNGNFNNDIGVPLTLLRLTEQHKFAVIELGANHQGEIAYTTSLVRPNVALINNVASAHLEGFGSIEGVAKAKGEIYRGLMADGIAIINLNCHYLPLWGKEINGSEVQSFSSDNTEADFYAKNTRITSTGSTFILHTPKGEININLPYLGEHNVSNALAATALAMNVGASLEQVKKGLEQQSQVKGRLYPIQVSENLLLLDDTYNANVGSLKSAISVLEKYQAYRILVVGDMAELGENTRRCHREVAEFAQAANLDFVTSYGHESAAIAAACHGAHFTDKTGLSNYLKELINEKLKDNQKVVLLAKGSRSMKMEDVINSLKDSFKC